MADPFVRCDSLCTGGSAKLLVCCVGDKSTRGPGNAKKLEDDSENTRLQNILKNLGSQFTYYSLIACFVILVLLLTMGVLASTTFNEDGDDAKDASNVNRPSIGGKLVEMLPETINLFVVLVVVAIPEGLPLTIQISLAFSVMRMYR